MDKMISSMVFICILTIVLLTSALRTCDGRAIIRDVTSNSTARSIAEEHFRKIEQRVCSSPVPKLYPVDDIFPIMDGNYKPHCVELHRCDNDAGCCKDDTEVCAPTEIETVHLYISVTGLFKTRILLMPFDNHTQCECQHLSQFITD
ncbi:hypothetical protein JTE90_012369 [Oedothorax gibbosus]|uniref:Platelet-derived growth factor (PDGF) family profile domain-containing protein n=1 Tax=Oedothorax gibbosus TaxID=931172 RepID=A0AAV6UQJ1_9ARAC|nr:hypothetical protein JTE90_012369 [Oedothorax gibbosus]